VADAAIETRLEPPTQQFEKVANPVHTLFLLLALSVVAVIGYFSVHRQGAVHQSHRLFFYLTTIAWEWILVAYVYQGLRRRGKSIRNIVGKSGKSVCDFFNGRRYGLRLLDHRNLGPQSRGSCGGLQGRE
jgi:hypothetical protein